MFVTEIDLKETAFTLSIAMNMNTTVGIVLCLGLLRLTGSAQSTVNITLTVSETAIINPSLYFSNQFSDFNITRSQSTSAIVLPQIETCAISEAETEGTQWRFGPSCTAMGFTYFAVIHTHKLEMWKVHGNSLKTEWETVGFVGKVICVHLAEIAGFVYWTLPNYLLYVIDLQSSPLSATEISGADMSNVLHFTICSTHSQVITARRVVDGLKFTIYYVDYSSHKLMMESEYLSDTEEVIDTFCTYDFFYLVTNALHQIATLSDMSFPLPLSLGAPKSIECLNSCEYFFIKTENGVYINSGHHSLILPIVSALQVSPRLIALEKVDFRLVLVTWDLYLQSRRIPVDQEIDSEDGTLWLGTDFKEGLFLLKRGNLIRLFTVVIDSAVLSVTGERRPYEVELCTPSTCVNITVNAMPADTREVLVRNSDYYFSASTIDLKYPLTHRQTDIVIKPIDLFSAPNLQVEVQNFFLPTCMELEICTEDNEEMRFQHIPIPLNNQNVDLLCAGFINEKLSYVFRQENATIEVSETGGSTVRVSTGLSFCALGDGYRVDLKQEEHIYVAHWANKDNIEIECDEGEYIAMKLLDEHIFILFRRNVEIVDTQLTQRQRIEGKADYREMRVERGWIVLRSARSFEFYQQKNYKYILRGVAPASPNVTQFVLCGSTLITLSDHGVLDVYYKTPSLQLIHRFSYDPHCPILYIASDGFYGVYRCPQYLQFLSCTRNKHSFELHRVNTESEDIPKLQMMRSESVFEIHQENGIWSLWKLTFHSQKDLCFHVKIANDCNIAEAISFQGEFLISTSGAEEVKITANITLENQLFITTNSSFLKAVEVPWDEELQLNLQYFFNGKLMDYDAESSNPQINARVHSPVTVEKLISVSDRPSADLQVAEEINTLFYLKHSQVVATRFECCEWNCTITSTHTTTFQQLGFFIVRSVEVLLFFNSKTYISISGTAEVSEGKTAAADAVFTFDSTSLSYELKYYQRGQYSKNHLVVAENANRFHLFFYDYDLVHCVGEASQLRCTEEQFPSLLQVVSLTGKAVGNCCHLYALTRDHQLVEMQLCESLTIVNATSVADLCTSANSMLVGNLLITNFFRALKVYSLLDRTLLFETDQVFITRVVAGKVMRTQPHFALLEIDTGAVLLDLVTPQLLAALPLKYFHFTSESRGAGFVNKTLFIVNFSHGEVVLPRDAAQTSGAEGVVTVFGNNELSSAKVTLRVVRVPKNRYWWIVAAFTVGCVLLLLYRRKKPNSQAEVELQRLT